MDQLITNFSVKAATDFFFKKFDTFKEDHEDYSDLLKDDRFSRLEKIGEATLADKADMVMFTCKSESDLTERSSKKAQYEIAKRVMKQERMDSAIAIFYDDKGNFRFSLVRQNFGDADQKFSTWKRYTYFVTKDQTNKTFRQRVDIADFTSLDKIQEAFSVDKLTKQFYEELFNWYLWALSEDNGFAVKFPNDTSVETDNRKIEEHLIRLITRLIFVWFIRRKKLIPDAIFNVDELEKILVDFNPASKHEGNYYNAILQNLFFACLNNPIEDRKFSTEDAFQGKAKDYGVKNLFRDNKKKTWFNLPKEDVVDIFKQVPFLNGGLFECLDKITENDKILYYDGFSRDEKTKDGNLKRAFVPNALFFDKTKGLITILEKYNFTVEENSVDDVEVALDPELLGKVFENLLAAYNPETKETARKQTGSFYTPREIVDFMVDQSLIQYLVTHNKDISKEDLEEFVLKKSLPKSFTKTKIAAVEEQIKTIKILDPACGSGAYPMGILTRLYELLTLLGGSSDNHYENKLTLIENCIYGVDIQSIAVQISKLRFFISLIVEQNPNDNVADNYGIKSLPNLETKFVAANTLIGLKQNSKDQLDLNDPALLAMKEELWDIRNHQNFRARSFKEKKELRKKDKELCSKIKNYIHKTAGGPNEEKIKANLAEIEKAEAKLENLPEVLVDITKTYSQVSMFEEERVTTPSMFQKDANEETRNKVKKQILALKKEIEFEQSKKGNVDTEEADNLISWDPYDQNSSSPFFDPEWMFGVESFDVVIGNPPYVEISDKKQKENFSILYKEVLSKHYDLYIFFYKKGLELLKKEGILTYITPHTFTVYSQFQALRDYIKSNTCIEEVTGRIENIFESAVVDNTILILRNTKSVGHNTTIFSEYKISSAKLETTSYEVLPQSDYNSISFNYKSILNFEKIKLYAVNSELLGEITRSTQGITVYAKVQGEKKNYFNNEKISDFSKPVLRGRDFIRYKIDWPQSFIEYGTWLWCARDPAFFSNPKLFVRQTSADIIATYVEDEFYCVDSVHSIIQASSEFELKYILAILNSKLGNYLYKLLITEDGKVFAQVKLTFLRRIPIKKSVAKAQEKIGEIVDEIIAKNKNDENSQALIDKLDIIIFKIYKVSYPEIQQIVPDISFSEEDYENFDEFVF